MCTSYPVLNCYITYHKGSNSLLLNLSGRTNDLLTNRTVEIRLLSKDMKANRSTLENIEKISVQVQNDAGGMLVI